MNNNTENLRQEMISLLGRIVGAGPLPTDLQRIALNIYASLAVTPHTGISDAAGLTAAMATADAADAPSGTTARRLICVHGICQHAAGFSNSWWESLHPFVPDAFGVGALGSTRLEVVWSDLVNEAAASLAAMAGPAGTLPSEEISRRSAAEEIKEALRDRTDQQMLSAAGTDGAALEVPIVGGAPGTFGSIPGVRCIDDFSIYLTVEGVRQQIIDRFIRVVRPQLHAGRELDIVGHSWGTVVAYEGLRLLEDEGVAAKRVRNLFTVGAALSIGPVKLRLRPANRDGRKPANVNRWVNLDARGDLVGGPLKNRPFQVDVDLVNLEPVGCGSFLGLINPQCAHSSYFTAGNVAVNRDIFAKYVNL